jgi:pimeloyl-ACP methyl ester carboxylesterase
MPRVVSSIALALAVLGTPALLLASPEIGGREDLRRGRFQALHDAPSDLPADAPRAPGLPPESERIHLRHPVVLAHGAVWFGALGIERLKQDYWTGTDMNLRRLGVKLIAPEVTPLGSIETRANELKAAILRAYPRGKVNVVAHSMGGLDARYMITKLGMGHRVASLTTLSTPHHGSFYADFARKYIGNWQGLSWLAGKAKIDHTALRDLTTAYMADEFNPVVPDDPGVAYFSYAGATKIWRVPFTQWGAKLVVTIAEKAAARKAVGRATRAALEKAIPGATRAALELGVAAQDRYDWILPEEAGRSDGVVSTSSARWGTFLGEVDAYHLGQIGSARRIDHDRIWERILRKLEELGY